MPLFLIGNDASKTLLGKMKVSKPSGLSAACVVLIEPRNFVHDLYRDDGKRGGVLKGNVEPHAGDRGGQFCIGVCSTILALDQLLSTARRSGWCYVARAKSTERTRYGVYLY